MLTWLTRMVFWWRVIYFPTFSFLPDNFHRRVESMNMRYYKIFLQNVFTFTICWNRRRWKYKNNLSFVIFCAITSKSLWDKTNFAVPNETNTIDIQKNIKWGLKLLSSWSRTVFEFAFLWNSLLQSLYLCNLRLLTSSTNIYSPSL